MATDIAVSATNLRRTFGTFVAVDGINFEIKKGEFFGFLGPNGAGKTTTMRMIYRATSPDGGELRVLGEIADGSNDRKIKQRVGVVPQEDNLDQEMSVAENLEVFARFYSYSAKERRQRVEHLLDFADLQAKRDDKVQKLSGGMKRRLMVARGMLGDPELIILDEPSTGLDPRARQRIWEKLGELRKMQTTVVLTTHYMEEAERLCDRIAIMDQGKIVALDSPANLIAKNVESHVVEVRIGYQQSASSILELSHLVPRIEELKDRILFYTDDPEPVISEVMANLEGYVSLVRRSSLDDVFLRLTGRGLEDT
jgi:lipooligosaccharide transport system ATP-binding protein